MKTGLKLDLNVIGAYYTIVLATMAAKEMLRSKSKARNMVVTTLRIWDFII